MSKTSVVRTYDKFEYHLEDLSCEYCKYYRGKKRGCSREYCCCEDEKQDAIANGRINRKRGWNK